MIKKTLLCSFCVILITLISVPITQSKNLSSLYMTIFEASRAGQDHRVIEAASEILKFKPEEAETYSVRGLSYRRTGQFDKALADYNKALELDPSDAVTYSRRGALLVDIGDYDAAIRDCSRAIQINPNQSEAYYNRGIAWGKKKNYNSAIGDYSMAIRINPAHPYPYINRASIWIEKEEYDRAIKDCDHAIKLSQAPLAYAKRGRARQKKGAYEKALEDFQLALQRSPGFFYAYRNIAWILATCPQERFRDGVQAVQIAKMAVQQYPSSYTLSALSAAYAETGEYMKAVRTQQEAIKMAIEKNTDEKEMSELNRHLKLLKSSKPIRD
jgi:tetratricopeptide (TPR) repeat protein